MSQRATVRLVATAALTASLAVATAQERTAGDGVYTSAQAMRGQTVFQTSCATCHQTDGIAPSLTGDRFAKFWTDANLNSLFTQVKTAMPRNAPGSLTEAAYTDVVAFLLAQNGFPAGADELQPASMDGIRIAVAGAPPAAVPDFTLVQVVGCLAQGQGHWTLRSATEPVRTREPEAPKDADTAQLDASPVGSRSFRLLQVYGAPPGWSGQRVVAKGFLVRSGAEERLTVTSMRPLASPCTN
jgi:mono/diheme cytochrome c family protein